MAASSHGSFSDQARTRLATGAGVIAGCSLIGVSIVALEHSVLRFDGWPVEQGAGATPLVGLPSPGTPSRGAGISGLVAGRPALPGVTSSGGLRPTAAVRPLLRPVVPRRASHTVHTDGRHGTSTPTRPLSPVPASPAPTTPVATPASGAIPAPVTSATAGVVASASADPTPPSTGGTLLNRHGKQRPPEPAKQAPSPSTSAPPPPANPVVAASDSNPPPGQGGAPPGQLKKAAGDAGRPGERRGEPKD